MGYSSETDIASTADPAVSRAQTTSWRWLRLAVSFPALMAVLLIAVALIGAESRLIDPDTWWHVAVGEQILKTHTWPTSDTFSFTARGAHWIAYEWLGEVFLALPAQAAGLVGLAWFQKAMVVVISLLIYLYSYLVCGNSKAMREAASPSTTSHPCPVIFDMPTRPPSGCRSGSGSRGIITILATSPRPNRRSNC